MNLFVDLWNDESGQVFLTEIALATTATAGVVTVGGAVMSGAVNNELEDLGHAIVSLDQSYDLGPAGSFKDDPAADRKALIEYERQLIAELEGNRVKDSDDGEKSPDRKKRRKKSKNKT